MSRLVLALWAFAVFSWAHGLQVPLTFITNESTLELWDIDIGPGINDTSHLLFDTVNSLLQHWPNTRYRNGHTIVPGTVPLGSVFYHGTDSQDTPTVPEWLATDPELSYLFCQGSQETGCWHHTYVTTRPLNVLYFDGSSAAKMQGGPMDSQDILLWGKVVPEWTMQERKRINELCAWGRPFGLDGFVRMEPDFEILHCDFTNGLQPVSKLNIVPAEVVRLPPAPKPGLEPFTIVSDNARLFITIIEAGSWHNHFPGDPRIQLDLSRLVSFYDTKLVPSLVPLRFKQSRFEHRLQNISTDDVQAVMKAITGVLAKPGQSSGIDWKGLFRVITLRYADRLEVIYHHLNVTEPETASRTSQETAHLILNQLRIILTPYILHTAIPSASIIPGTNSWASPVYQYCATTHTNFITSISSRLTPSERLLLSAVRGTNREICRVIVKIWAEAVAEGLDPALLPSGSPRAVMDIDEDKLSVVLDGWRSDISELIDWLDWSLWIKCRPACGFEEMCYLPTWPFFRRPQGDDPTHRRPFPTGPTYGDEIFPQPRCIRKVPPYRAA